MTETAFSADTLIESTCEETGLRDFGTTAWRDGLDALLDAAEREADSEEPPS